MDAAKLAKRLHPHGSIKVEDQRPMSEHKSDQPDSIGVATMRADGTIVLQLRAEGVGGIVGDAQVTYSPSDPKYQEILAHLGGLKPGESKPVRPWKDPGFTAKDAKDAK
jgi:hypothetical protein